MNTCENNCGWGQETSRHHSPRWNVARRLQWMGQRPMSAFDLLYRCNVFCGTRAGLEENLLLLLSLKENQSWQAPLFSGVPFCNYFFWIFWPGFFFKSRPLHSSGESASFVKQPTSWNKRENISFNSISSRFLWLVRKGFVEKS